MAANAGKLIPHPAQTYSTRSLRFVAVCFLFSGATGLIYEVLWARMLGLVFGVTTLAISAVLAAFMGGLALGSMLASRFAARIVRAVRVYAVIEIVIGLYALAVPFLFRLIDGFYAAVWQKVQPGFYGSAAIRFALASIVLIVPTALMGATLPVLARALSAPKQGSISVTSLYTFNLVGAIAGTIAAGFVLLPSLGVTVTIWIAALTNLIIGAFALVLDHKEKNGVTGKSGVEAVTGQPANQPAAVNSSFWLFCALVSGLVTIGMQVVWSRLLSMIIGSSTYAFSIVLALFLTGLSLGAYIVSRRRNSDLRSVRRTIFVVQLLIAAGLFFSIRVANLAPSLLVGAGFRLGINSWGGLMALQICVAALLILLPSVLMGMVMPLVLKWAEQSRPGSAQVVGEIPGTTSRLVGLSYAMNTLGAIVGSILTAFFLIPGTSTRFTIFCIAALCLIAAGIAFEPRRVGADRALVRSLAAGVTAVLIVVTLFVWPKLNLNALSTGAYDGYVRVLAKSRGGVPQNTGDDRAENHQLLMFQEGRTATVSVRRDWGITSLAINGRTNGSDTEDMPTQVFLAHVGLLTAPHADNALMIGFATGVTAGSILQGPIKSVDCVELEPATMAASRFFEHVNGKPLADPRLRMILDDARTHLRVNPTRYDIIVSEPSHPWVPGVANLFTREFFSLGKERLRDDGVFVQWLQMYQLSTESLRSVLATYHEVFPHVLVFRVRGEASGKDLILVGSRQPLTLNYLAARISDARVAADLARIRMNRVEDVRAWLVTDETTLGPAVAGAVINTDDNMHVETVAPREAFRPTMEENAAWIEKLKVPRP